MKQLLLLAFMALMATAAMAQRDITGTVTGDGEPLIGATVQVKGTIVGTVTDLDGMYKLRVPEGSRTLTVAFIGYTTQEVAIAEGAVTNIVLSSGELLNEVVILGSRGTGRTKLETTAPVDVIDIKDISSNSGQTTVNAILNYVAPSFSSNTQTISDGTDHIDPAALRGLGPDQVLVLINGKRRHTSSLVNVNGTFGRGAVGTDLNAIPVAAIARIEVLRDGAAAQYGSDAIAGVINIVLKSETGLSFSANTGAHISSEIPEQDGTMDGEMMQIAVNYGAKIGDKGGFVNLTGAFDNRLHTNRMKEASGTIFRGYNNPNHTGAPGEDITEAELQRRGLRRSDFNMRVGQSELRNAGAVLNMELPLGGDATLYAFGGLNYRNGAAAGFYRMPFQERTVTDIHPNGFLPFINSNIVDRSFGVGVRNRIKNWDVDFSNVYGFNGFDYFITNTNNASMGSASPTSFDAGGFSFMQNTTNFDVRRYFDDVLSGLNIAFGAEYRLENYRINAGEEASYRNYGLATRYITAQGDTLLIQDGRGPVNTVFGPNGAARPGGAQVFPGFTPDNALSRYRSSLGLYFDTEVDITKAFLVGAAVRLEDYSDFGSILTGKLSGRYKITDNISLRATGSTGFRAPSLHQLNFNSTSTLFVDGVPFEVGVFSNDSRVAKVLGIEDLKPEKSTSFSAGITGKLSALNMSITVDAFMVDIVDRVVLTGNFSGSNAAGASEQDKEIFRLLQAANANRGAFFVNAIDTRTQGIDIVLSQNANVGRGRLNTILAATFAQTTLSEVKPNNILAGKESIYFDRTSQIFLENAVPNTKVNLTFNYNLNRFNIMLRNVYFGEVREATNVEANDQTFAAKVVTDLSIGYGITKNLRLTIGANNLLDVYPDMNIEANQGGGQFLYSRRSQQFGANGRFLFARASFSL